MWKVSFVYFSLTTTSKVAEKAYSTRVMSNWEYLTMHLFNLSKIETSKKDGYVKKQFLIG